MITGRRAERFHELVEHGAASDPRTPEYAELLVMVGALRGVPEPVADAAFVAALRDRLVAEAERVLVAAAAERDDTDARLTLPRLRASPARPGHRRRRVAAVVSGVALVGASATVAVAAQSALPGDGLYSVKRGIENAHAGLTFDRAARGRLLLGDAWTRLDEAQQLSREQADPALVDDALTAFTQQAVAGSDLLVGDYDATGNRSSITSVRTFAVSGMDRLKLIQSEIPPRSLDSLLQAAQTLDQVQQTATYACPSCAGPVIGSVPSVLVRAAQATADSWLVAVPRSPAGGAGRPGGRPVLPHLPSHLPSHLPPASVTDPGPLPTSGQPQAPTAGDVRHTVADLTSGLRHRHQNDVGSTVTDAASNLLDAVGQLGDQVANTLGNTVDNTVGGIQSALPSLPPLP